MKDVPAAPSHLWPIALGLFGAGLLAASTVTLVWITRPSDVTTVAGGARAPDWTRLLRFEGREVRTGGLQVGIRRVLIGDAINPLVRDVVRAGCQDAIVFVLVARNVGHGEATVVPGDFQLFSKTKLRMVHSEGFDPPRLAEGAERTYRVGYAALTTELPCIFAVDGDALRQDPGPDEAVYRATIDVCPAPQ